MKKIFMIIGIVLIAATLFFYAQMQKSGRHSLPTYFSYDAPEIQMLHAKSSKKTIQAERDAAIQTYMPTPNHPSYPANATAAAVSAALLGHYFPGRSNEWQVLSEEAGNSRVWSGIPPEIQSKIFEPFFTTKDVGKGTGLGLSLVYEIVQRHEGRIKVDSKAEKGSVFTIQIPTILPK